MRRVVTLFVSTMAVTAVFTTAEASGTPARPAAVDPWTPISSDGSVTPVAELAGGISPGFEGSGRTTPTFAPATSGGPVLTAGATEGIFGTDTRARVNPTTAYPSRATVLIYLEAGRCSGAMISRNTVLTAGHCLHRGSGGQSGFFAVESFRIVPGANASLQPYGSCRAIRLHTTSAWANDGNDEYDYGAIRLNCSVGDRTGWYGYSTGARVGQSLSLLSYPGDKPIGTQWRSLDQMRALLARLAFFRNDTHPGASGGPLYITTASCTACIVAINTTEPYRFPWPSPYIDNNTGVRITSQVYNNLTTWKNQP